MLVLLDAAAGNTVDDDGRGMQLAFRDFAYSATEVAPAAPSTIPNEEKGIDFAVAVFKIVAVVDMPCNLENT